MELEFNKLGFGMIKKLYKAFRRNPANYPMVIDDGSAALRHYELKWGPLDQEPMMELVAAEMIKSYPQAVKEILGRKVF